MQHKNGNNEMKWNREVGMKLNEMDKNMVLNRWEMALIRDHLPS